MSQSSDALSYVRLGGPTLDKGPFGRMFSHDDLPPWEPLSTDPDKIEERIRTFAENKMSEAPGEVNLDNAKLPAGYTYFGQFVDHDITFDPTSSLQRRNDPHKLHNFRTPRLDLDCIYGEGPDDEPFMYDQNRGGMMLIGQVQKDLDGNVVGKSKEPDLPRNVQGRALIGDMRNDENLIISQFHLAMLRLHNAVYGQLMGVDPDYTTAKFPSAPWKGASSLWVRTPLNKLSLRLVAAKAVYGGNDVD